MPNFDKKTYIVCFLIIFCVILYFLINYQVKSTLHSELKKISDKKKKRQKLAQIRQTKLMEMRQGHEEERNMPDMDSYVDPAEKYVDDNNDDGYDRQQRLNKDDMMMRDIRNT